MSHSDDYERGTPSSLQNGGRSIVEAGIVDADTGNPYGPGIPSKARGGLVVSTLISFGIRLLRFEHSSERLWNALANR